MKLQTLPAGADGWARAAIRSNIELNSFENAVFLRVQNSPGTSHYYLFLKDSHKDLPDKTHTERLKDKLSRFVIEMGVKNENVTAYRVPNEYFPQS